MRPPSKGGWGEGKAQGRQSSTYILRPPHSGDYSQLWWDTRILPYWGLSKMSTHVPLPHILSRCCPSFQTGSQCPGHGDHVPLRAQGGPLSVPPPGEIALPHCPSAPVGRECPSSQMPANLAELSVNQGWLSTSLAKGVLGTPRGTMVVREGSTEAGRRHITGYRADCSSISLGPPGTWSSVLTFSFHLKRACCRALGLWPGGSIHSQFKMDSLGHTVT